MVGITNQLPTNVTTPVNSSPASQSTPTLNNSDDVITSAQTEEAPVSRVQNEDEVQPTLAASAENSSTNTVDQRGSLIDIEV